MTKSRCCCPKKHPCNDAPFLGFQQRGPTQNECIARLVVTRVSLSARYGLGSAMS